VVVSQEKKVAAEIQIAEGCKCNGKQTCGFCCLTSGQRGRFNKTGYFVQVDPGNPSAGGRWIPAGSVCVASRRINPGNGRAVVRAVRRAATFDRLARKVKKQLKAAAR